jgi:hypothetical protein
MKLTDSMRRCLILLDQYGEALRVWSGSHGYQWSWRINGIPVTRPVDRCILAGLVRVETPDRVILSPRGRLVLDNL